MKEKNPDYPPIIDVKKSVDLVDASSLQAKMKDVIKHQLYDSIMSFHETYDTFITMNDPYWRDRFRKERVKGERYERNVANGNDNPQMSGHDKMGAESNENYGASEFPRTWQETYTAWGHTRRNSTRKLAKLRSLD